MALTIGELVGFIRADDSGFRRGISDARLRMRGLQRSTDGTLRDIRGRFVSEGEAAGRGLADGIRAGADAVERRLGAMQGAIRGISLGMAGVSAGSVGAAGAIAAVPLAVIGLGAKVLAENEQVQTAFSDLRSHVTSELSRLAQPLVKPFVEAAGQLQEIFDDIAPHIGQAFEAAAPMVGPLVDGIGQFAKGVMPGFVEAIESAQPVIEALADGLGSIGEGLGGFFSELSSGSDGAATGLGSLLDTIGDLLPVAGSLLGSLATLGGPILAGVRSAVEPLIDMVSDLADWLGRLVDSIPPSVLSGIASGFVAIALGVKAYQTAIRLASLATRAWAAVQALWNAVMMANPIGLVIGLIVGLVAIIVIAYKRSETFRNIVQAVWAAIRSAIGAAVDWIVAKVAWFATLPGKISGWFGQAKDWAIKKWNELVAWVRGLPRRISSALSGLAGQMRSRATQAGRALVSAIRSRLSEAVNWVKGLPRRARNALGNLGRTLRNAGRALIRGFISGIRSMIGSAKSAARSVVSSVRNLFPFSPAKEGPFSGSGYTTHSGRALIEGFQKGISAQAPRLRTQVAGVLGGLPPLALPSHARPGVSTLPGAPAASGMQQPQRIVLEVQPGSSGRVEALLTHIIRETVAVKGGGDVQATFGKRR